MTGWQKAEMLAMRALLEAGYAVHRAMPTYQRVGSQVHLIGNDFWGLADIVAIGQVDIRLVQVKSGATYRGPTPDWRLKLEALRRPANTFVEYWWLSDSGLWRITRWNCLGDVVAIAGEVAS